MASCAICSKPALFRCGKCKSVRYCSRECQKDHWPHHKRQCPQLAAAFKDDAGSAPDTGGSPPAPAQLGATDGNGQVPANSVAPSASPDDTQLPYGAQLSCQPQLQPRPPAQPQPPAVSRSARSSHLTANPRNARLPSEPQPGVQGNAASAALTTAATALAAGGDAAVSLGGDAAVSLGGTTAAAPAATAGLAASAAAAMGGASQSAAAGTCTGGNNPPPALAPASPPCHRPQPPFAPRPPSALPAARHPSGLGSVSITRRIRLGKGQSQDAAAASVMDPGQGLSVEGVSVGAVGAGGGMGGLAGSSIMDRILPPSPRPAQPAPPPLPQQQLQPPGSPSSPTLNAAAGAPPGVGDASAGAPSRAGAMSPPAAALPPPSPSPSSPVALSPWPWTHPLGGSGGCGGGCRTGAAAAGLTDLPPEVLLEVLKALPARSLAAASRVCRSWRRAAREPWLWVRQLCAAGYTLPAAALVAGVAARRPAAAACASHVVVGGAGAAGGGGDSDEAAEAAGPGTEATDPSGCGAARAVPGVRGIRAVRAVRAAGGSSHHDFLGGLRAGFLDRLQHQAAAITTTTTTTTAAGGFQTSLQHPQHPPHPPPAPGSAHALATSQPLSYGTPLVVDLKALYGRTVRTELNWRTARYAESALREHSSNVECLTFQAVEPWGSVLLSAAWDGSVRVFSLGPGGPGWQSGGGGGVGAGGGPQQVRCVRRYRGHTGWITCMAAGRYQVVTASTDRRVAAWRYYSESSDPWVTLEHTQEVTLVRFCYAAPPGTAATAATNYLAHHLCPGSQGQGTGAGAGGGPHSGLGSAGEGGGPAGRNGLPGLPPELFGGGPGSGAAAGRLSGRGGDGHEGAVVRPGQWPGAGGPGSLSYGSSPHGSHHHAREAVSSGRQYDPQWEDWIVTGCIDGIIRLWHLPTKQLLRVFLGHTDVVWGIAVLYGSSVMVSSSRDGNTRLWQLPRFSQMQAAVIAAPAQAAEAGAPPAVVPQTSESMATLCGHSSAILCMDTHRVPPGVVPRAPPPGAAGAAASSASVVSTAAAAAAASGGTSQPDEVQAAHTDMVAVLAHLLNTELVSVVPEPQPLGGPADADQAIEGVSPADKAAAASAAAAGKLPVWLVATGGADAVVRVWDLASAQCLSTLRGHTVGVLSVQFGYLPRHAAAVRDQQLLPPDLDVSAAAPQPFVTGGNLTLPPGQYGNGYVATANDGGGGCCGLGQRLPPAQRLVLVTGSVREVRVWDPVAGTALAKLDDHSGPVTSIALLHGVLVTLAMNDGLIVYKCNGLSDPDEKADKAGGRGGGGGVEAAQARPEGLMDGESLPGSNNFGGGVGGGGAVGRLRGTVAAQRRPLEPVICMQDSPHHAFAAALAVQLEGLAVGSGTGDITYLDFRPRASHLPPVLPGRR